MTKSMPGDSELTDREILERMREHVNASQGGGPNAAVPLVRSSRQFAFIADKGVPGYYLGRLRQDVEVVYQLQSSVGTVNPRPPGLTNQAIQFSKKMMARLLSWYTRPLHQFQAAVAYAFEEQLHALESMQNQINSIVAANQQRTEVIEQDARRLIRPQERFAFLSDQSERLPESSSEASQFQQRSLGSQVERQHSYVTYFQGKTPVWDLAARNGEFLQLLREHGIAGQGAESSPDGCRVCLDKGLQVTSCDPFQFLQNSADSSAGGIFAAGLLERLPAELQLHLFDLCSRKLKPGAPLVFDTINPECLFGLAKNFYLDPANVRPVHYAYLRFALEKKGFRDVKISFMEPVEGEFLETPSWPSNPSSQDMTKTIMSLNHVAFGFQFYGVVAWRP